MVLYDTIGDAPASYCMRSIRWRILHGYTEREHVVDDTADWTEVKRESSHASDTIERHGMERHGDGRWTTTISACARRSGSGSRAFTRNQGYWRSTSPPTARPEGDEEVGRSRGAPNSSPVSTSVGCSLKRHCIRA